MFRRTSLALGGILLLLGMRPTDAGAAAEPGQRQPANAAVLSEAWDILTNLHASHYSHKVTVRPAEGVYEMDCSELGALLLKKSAPASLKELPIEPGYRRPRAVSFYNAFTNATDRPNGHWQCITRLEEARPGDFIAWRKPTIPPQGSSGHLMIIMEKPVRETNGSFRVKVLDSTSTPHAQDSRTNATGIGTGTVWFSVDAGGGPRAFRTSDRTTGFRPCLLAVGRAWRRETASPPPP